MPKASVKKIALGRNKFLLVASLFLVFIVILLLWGIFGGWQDNDSGIENNVDVICLDLEGECIVELDVADTYEARRMGLSGRESMAENQGMLFIFDEPGLQCFWMKDMNFDIDMIWLDASKTVTKIDKNVAKETYPDNFCQDDVMYVVEVVSGWADKNSVKIGQKLDF